MVLFFHYTLPSGLAQPKPVCFFGFVGFSRRLWNNENPTPGFGVKMGKKPKNGFGSKKAVVKSEQGCYNRS